MITQEKRNDLAEILYLALERDAKTDQVENGYDVYVVPLQGKWYRTLMTEEEVKAAIEFTIDILEEFRVINSNGINGEEWRRRRSEAGNGSFKAGKIINDIATERLSEIIDDVADLCSVGGAYWLVMAYPVFASALFAVFDRIVDMFDNEERYNQCAYFLLRAMLKIHSDEVDKPVEEA